MLCESTYEHKQQVVHSISNLPHKSENYHPLVCIQCCTRTHKSIRIRPNHLRNPWLRFLVHGAEYRFSLEQNFGVENETRHGIVKFKVQVIIRNL